MKFKVSFRHKTYLAIDLNNQPVGTQHLDELREELELPHFPSERVEPYIRGEVTNPEFTIAEEIARLAGGFEENWYRVVQVPRGFLNTFLERVSVLNQQDNGEINSVEMKMKLNEAAVVDAWLADGAPENWGIEE